MGSTPARPTIMLTRYPILILKTRIVNNFLGLERRLIGAADHMGIETAVAPSCSRTAAVFVSLPGS